MTDADFLRGSFVSLEVNDDCSEAIVGLSDGSALGFRHRVAERTVRIAAGVGDDTFAARVLRNIARFRLNAKHLDLEFQDGSRWETRLARG